MGRDESIFPNANSFVPERWLRENKEENDIHPYSSLPFSYGARSCIGEGILLACFHERQCVDFSYKFFYKKKILWL